MVIDHHKVQLFYSCIPNNFDNMRTQKSFDTTSSRRLFSMVSVISSLAFARRLEEKVIKKLPWVRTQAASLSMLTALVTFAAAPALAGQNMIHFAPAPFAHLQMPMVELNPPPQFRGGPTQLAHPLVSTTANDAWLPNKAEVAYNANRRPILGMAGLPAGPSQTPYPVPRTLANDALVRNNAWAAYNASVHPNTNLEAAETSATVENPNRLATRQTLLDQDRFIQMPQSSGRYNFQFSDNEIRLVQAALRRLGIYSGQVDGILGPETRRAVEDYQVKNELPVTGQPDQTLNALLGIF
jgi:hypothetical protein